MNTKQLYRIYKDTNSVLYFLDKENNINNINNIVFSLSKINSNKNDKLFESYRNIKKYNILFKNIQIQLRAGDIPKWPFVTNFLLLYKGSCSTDTQIDFIDNFIYLCTFKSETNPKKHYIKLCLYKDEMLHLYSNKNNKWEEFDKINKVINGENEYPIFIEHGMDSTFYLYFLTHLKYYNN